MPHSRNGVINEHKRAIISGPGIPSVAISRHLGFRSVRRRTPHRTAGTAGRKTEFSPEAKRKSRTLAQLFKGWITLSTGYHYPVYKCYKTNCAFHWIVIYPMDIVIHPLNNVSLTDLLLVP